MFPEYFYETLYHLKYKYIIECFLAFSQLRKMFDVIGGSVNAHVSSIFHLLRAFLNLFLKADYGSTMSTHMYICPRLSVYLTAPAPEPLILEL